MKQAMKVVLAAAIAATAVPRYAFAEDVSIEQAIAIQKQQNEQTRLQLLTLKAQLSDMQTELEKEQGRFGYQASKWTRNLSLTIAAFASIATVVNYKTSTNRGFFLYGLIGAAAGLVSGLGEVGVILTNDQVVTLEAKIKDLQKRIVAVEANLAKQQ